MKTQCPHCKVYFNVKHEYLNKKVKCSKCQQDFVVTEHAGDLKIQNVKEKMQEEKSFDSSSFSEQSGIIAVNFCRNCQKELNEKSRTFIFRGAVVCQECYKELKVLNKSASMKFAVSSLILALLSIFVGTILIPGISIILGIIALAKIGKCKFQSTAKTISIAGIIISGFSLLVMYPFFELPAKRQLKASAQRLLCIYQLKSLETGLHAYAEKHDGKLPTAEKWCDLLIINGVQDASVFCCKSSDAIIGESSYALNKHIVNKNLSEISYGTVLLFETNFGKSSNRNEYLKNRNSYNDFSETLPSDTSSTKVYELRWNQVGGPEILTTENHKGKGTNIVFTGGDIRFVETEDLKYLQWGN